MVDRRVGKVRLEVVPWLTQAFGKKGSARLVLDEEVEGEPRLADFLSTLSDKYAAVGTSVYDRETGRLFDHVTIVHNEVLLNSDEAPQQRIREGDTLVFLPAFAGG